LVSDLVRGIVEVDGILGVSEYFSAYKNVMLLLVSSKYIGQISLMWGFGMKKLQGEIKNK
jgi:hypothetical protein